MKDPGFYMNRANDLTARINEFKEQPYTYNQSIEELVIETELLFFGYSENYPTLLDLRQMKERYSGNYSDFHETIANKLILVLALFISYLIDITSF